MAAYDRFHWRLFTILLRTTGIVFTFGGLVLVGWSIHLVVNPEASYSVNELESFDKGSRWTLLVMALVQTILGVALLLARSFRPDLGDINIFQRFVDPIETKNQKSPQGSRFWWTGDPKPPVSGAG